MQSKYMTLYVIFVAAMLVCGIIIFVAIPSAQAQTHCYSKIQIFVREILFGVSSTLPEFQDEINEFMKDKTVIQVHYAKEAYRDDYAYVHYLVCE